MPQTDGTITSRDLCNESVTQRILQDGSVSALKISTTLESDNFVTGVSGWQINRATGSAEFNDVTVRGDLYATTLKGTMTIESTASGVLYTAPFGNNRLKFTVNSMTGLDSTDVQNGDVTISPTGVLVSDSSNVRFQISDVDDLYFWDGAGVESLRMDHGAQTWMFSDRVEVNVTGSAASPALEIGSGTTSGFYTAGSDLRFSIGGVGEWSMDSVSLGSLAGTGSPYIASGVGSAGSPVYTFVGDVDLGLYRVSSNTLGFASGTALRFSMNTTNFFGTATGSALMRSAAGAVGTPAFSFVGDTTTGMYRSSAGVVRIATAGTARFTVDSGGVYSANGIWATGTTGTNDYMELSETGNYFRVLLDGTVYLQTNTSGNTYDGGAINAGNPANTAAGWNIAKSGWMHVARSAVGSNILLQKVGSPGFNSIMIAFYYGSTEAGTIHLTDSTTTVYGSTSDYRLKRVLGPIDNPMARLRQVSPVAFEWLESGKAQTGYLAHEAAEIIPWGVGGEKDGDGYQSMDAGKLIPDLHAAILELDRRLEALEEVTG